MLSSSSSQYPSSSSSSHIPSQIEQILLTKQFINTCLDNHISIVNKLHYCNNELEQANETINQYKTKINTIKSQLLSIKTENEILHEQINTLKLQNKEMKHYIMSKGIPGKTFTHPMYIEGIEHELQMNNLHSDYITCLLELTDQRIVSGSYQSIAIHSINIDTKQWTTDIQINNAHDGTISSLCESTNNTLISGSYDYSIKIWEVHQNALHLITKLVSHTNAILTITTINNGFYLASGSLDKSIKIWNNNAPFQEVTSITIGYNVYSLLQIINEDILVISCDSPSISFWNTNTFVKLGSINGIYAINHTHMIQLPNKFIAVSSYIAKNSIVIIDPFNYVVIKEIQVDGFIMNCSSICVWDAYSFIYIHNRYIVQIDIGSYKVMYKSNVQEDLSGYKGIITYRNAMYIVVTNKKKGLEIVKAV